MISSSNGDLQFERVSIKANATISEVLRDAHFNGTVRAHKISSVSFQQWEIGIQTSDYGEFESEISTDEHERIKAVFLRSTIAEEPSDYYDRIILQDLKGQREFSWGSVLIRPNKRIGSSWLCVTYSDFSSVPYIEKLQLLELVERHPLPRASSTLTIQYTEQDAAANP